ncbi:thioester domain-containing protein [Prauserella cavernicola]|uniref:Thioester domain-containing protein n=1 Tax=Prauserella cavernicola TaxID=2800127 RepID=A0A934V4V8_9PSEU|nr:thioester domain-containing protein [Prauserella cavernicola]MBK1784510.1 thioester domain-containing protein [Prauserella cavernicola]
MHSRSAWRKAGAALVGASVAVVLSALPASAEDVNARFDEGSHAKGYSINVGGKNLGTTLFGLKVDDDSLLRAYCVEIAVSVDPSRSLSEKPWDEFPNPESPFHENRDKLNWVLHHSYPALELPDIEGTLAEQGVEFDNGLDEKEAISATQAAVWHYSDGKDLDTEKPLKSDDEGAAKDVVALYEYLTSDANVGIGDEPNQTLGVTPDTIAGKAGERIGPFTVTTTGGITAVNGDLPEGVKLVDADGAELAPEAIENGTEFFVDVPADAAEGSASFELEADAQVDTGRLFVAKKYNKKPAQSLIVAHAEQSKLKTGAGVSWTEGVPETTEPPVETTTEAPPTTSSEVAAPPTTEAPVSPQADSGDLAETGVSIMTPIIIGAVLLGAGVGALLLQRRRNSA